MIKKGEIYWADLSESDNCVQYGRRPVCVLGNSATCASSPIVSVAPLSSRMNKAKKIPTHVVLKNALKKESVILPEQIRCISKKALLGNAIYRLSDSEMSELDNAIIRQFGLH